MLAAINRTTGKNIGFPDPCLTPMVPAPVMLPYPNFADHAQAILFSITVKICGAHALNMGSKIPITSGHEPGSANPLYKMMGLFTAGNPIVKVSFLAAISLLCPTTGNNMNNGLGAVLVPPVVNVFFTYAAPGSAAPVTAEPAGGPGAEGAAVAGQPSFDGPLTLREVEALASELRSAGRDGEPSVSSSEVSNGVGTIAIRVFSADVPGRFELAVEALLREGMERLVLDLRDNPGGELTTCAELLGDFFPSGTPLFALVDGDGDQTVFRGWNPRPHTFEVTVLVNRATASAAELFAAVLEARGRAVVVGGPMFGKDTVQRVVVSPEGAAARVTVGRWRVSAEGE